MSLLSSVIKKTVSNAVKNATSAASSAKKSSSSGSSSNSSSSTNSNRNTALAGQSVKEGQYTVTYDDRGYVVRKTKDGGASATSTVKTTHANDSADHQAAYDAAQRGDWDAVGTYINKIGMAGGTDSNGNYDMGAANQYLKELSDEFKYNAKDYYDKKYEETYSPTSSGSVSSVTGSAGVSGQQNPVIPNNQQGTAVQNPTLSGSGSTDWSSQLKAAMDGGASADVVEYLLNQRNSKIAANQAHYASLGISDSDSISQAAKAYIQQKRAAQEQMTEQMPTWKYGSFEEFKGDTGYDDYSEKMKAAIQASVDQAVNGYKGQIDTTNQQSDDMARQAWVAKRLAEKNLDQQLSASGYAGGMADSQKISLESSYQDQLTDIEKQRLQTVKDLETAITNAQLTGDMQAAQELSAMLQQIQSQWNSYVQSQQQLGQQNYWKQKELDNQNYWNEQEIAAQNKGDAYTRALTLISQGFMPDDETLAAAGITRAAAQQKLDQQLAAAAVAAGTTGGRTSAVRTASGGGSYNNGSLTTEQVKQLQQALGVTADGLWGSQSKAAAGGLTADQAWAQYSAGGAITQYDQLSPAAKQLLSNMQRNSARTGTELLTAGRLEMIKSALNNGEISDAEANYILDTIGA